MSMLLKIYSVSDIDSVIQNPIKLEILHYGDVVDIAQYDIEEYGANSINWHPFNGAKSIIKTERGNQLTNRVFDRFQTGDGAENINGRFASPVSNSSEGIEDLNNGIQFIKIKPGTKLYRVFDGYKPWDDISMTGNVSVPKIQTV